MKIAPKKSLFALLSVAAAALTLLPAAYAEDASDESSTVSSAAPELVEGETFTDEILTYNKAEGGVYITACSINATSVSIGGEIDGYRILGIYDGAFAERDKLRSVEISDEVSYIGTSAFASCELLESVKLPSGITEIPAQCFAACSSLKDLEIPDTVESIGAYAFSYCDNLSGLEIPESVRSVEDYAFAYSNLGDSLKLWEGLETLGSMSFYYCRGIKNVSIPASLTSIGSLSFLGCEDLERFEVSPDSLYFKETDGILYSKDETILEIFPMGKNLTDFTIPDSVQYIPSGAFFDNPFLENIVMPDSVEAVGEAAFSNCTALKSITLSSKLTELPGSIFCDCSSLKSIEIPQNVTTIGDYAFLECTSLKSVTIPDGVEALGEYALGFTDDDDGEFHRLDGFEIKANYETAARKYAKSNRISIEYLDGNKDLPYIITLIVVGVIAVAEISVISVILIRNKKKRDEFYKI